MTEICHILVTIQETSSYIVLSTVKVFDEEIDVIVSRLANGLVTGCMALALGACTIATTLPTHRWASTNDADKARYSEDHATCQVAANLSASSTELDTSSEAFVAYKQCMNNSGYVLTAYNN